AGRAPAAPGGRGRRGGGVRGGVAGLSADGGAGAPPPAPDRSPRPATRDEADLDRLADAIAAGAFETALEGAAALEGAFSVAALDLRAPGRPALTLLRDAMGPEPLPYAIRPDGLVLFSTWIHHLRAVPGLDGDPDPAAVEEFLIFTDLPDGGTVWPGIAELPQGGLLRADASGAARRVHWRPGPDRALRGLSDAAQVEAGREIARAAVVSRLDRLGARPAIMYSGGLDSSLVAALACEAAGGADVPAVSSVSTEGAAETEAASRAALQAHWPNLKVTPLRSDAATALGGSRESWLRHGLPNIDPTADTYFGIPRAMAALGRDAALGGFGGDMVVSHELRDKFRDDVMRLRVGEAAREWRMLRAEGYGRKYLFRLVWVMTSVGWRLRWHRAGRTGLDEVRVGPALDPARMEEWIRNRFAPFQHKDASVLVAERRGVASAATWTICDFHLPGPGGLRAPPQVVAYGTPLLDTRLMAAAMAAPARLKRLDGQRRGYIRRLLAPVAPEGVTRRPDKSAFQPDGGRLLAEALPRLETDLAAFAADLRMWRDLVDPALLSARLERLRAQGRNAAFLDQIGVVRAWNFGRFLSWAEGADFSET
ncbi:MAG: asparagine synthase-related protein, partial [Pseudomonadota bacterium]|nr:asparagine synthase-related protein [Pseudomonadota bacterium]